MPTELLCELWNMLEKMDTQLKIKWVVITEILFGRGNIIIGWGNEYTFLKSAIY